MSCLMHHLSILVMKYFRGSALRPRTLRSVTSQIPHEIAVLRTPICWRRIDAADGKID